MIDPNLQKRLDPVARAIHRRKMWRDVANCWVFLGIVGLVALIVNHFTGWFPSFGHVSPKAGFLVWAGILALLCLRNYLRRKPDYLDIAREIEANDPALHSVLITAVEQKAASPDGRLNYLQQRVVEDALRHNDQHPWAPPFQQLATKAQVLHWAAFVGFALVLMAMPAASPSRRSNVAAKVTSTSLANKVTVSPGDVSVERGNGLVVLAKFDGKLPAEATLVIKPANQNPKRIPLVKNLDDPVFGGSISEVNSELKYSVEYTGGHTPEYKVSVFEYPRLDHADARITYPAYTGLREKLVPDTRRISAIEGSTLDYSFYLNKPVVSATLVAKDKSVVKLDPDPASPALYHSKFLLDQSRRYELFLVDDAGRTNRIPPEFVLDALQNRPPELKFALPRGDQRVSPIEEITFQAEASGQFGLRAYGIGYNLAGGETKTVQLGGEVKPGARQQLNYLLPVEHLAAKPGDLLSYFVWADDFGPDGKPRRSTSDLFFAEIRPFDEIFRERQGGGEGGGGEEGGGGQEQDKLLTLQKDVTTATWNLQRRESRPPVSTNFAKDVAVIREAQDQAGGLMTQASGRITDRQAKAFSKTAEENMKKSLQLLDQAVSKKSAEPLVPALARQQEAYQALLKLKAREHQVSRARNRQGGGGGGGQQQDQINELDLQQTSNNYETERQASRAQNPAQREQLQVANRLKELAQRQKDFNDRLRELQTALQEAKTEREREELRQRLKRLAEEDRDLVADVDELRQRMDRPENQSRMSDARQKLDQTRSEIEKSAQDLKQENTPGALAEGSRASRELQQLHDDFRRETSNQFSEQMRRMREDARSLAQNQERIASNLLAQASARRKTLNDSTERREMSSGLDHQKTILTNLFNEMREVSEQAEPTEPLLSKQLYDTLRRTSQDDITKPIDLSSQLIDRGFLPQATEYEKSARQGINDLKKSVEHAAESVLGDDTESLKLAKRELDNLSEQLDKELSRSPGGRDRETNALAGAQGGSQRGRNQPGQGTSPETASSDATSSSPGQSPGEGQGQAQGQGQGQRPGQGQGQGQGQRSGQGQGQGQRQSGQPGQNGQGGQGGQGGDTPSDQETASAGQAGGGGRGGRGRRGGNQQGGPNRGQAGSNQPGSEGADSGASETAGASNNGGGGGGGGGGRYGSARGGANNNGGGVGGEWRNGPITGEDFVNWSDRLRDVEEMVDSTDLRTQVARARDQARAMRAEFKRLGKQPDWGQVRSQIANPLAEVRSRIAEELARRESQEALVPLDRDPVPTKYSELVRHYYERLGKTD